MADETEKAAVARDGGTRTVRGMKWALLVTCLSIMSFLNGLDTTIAADIQGAVVREFDRVDQLAWIGAGYPLGMVAVILPFSFLYASFNMKWIFIAGSVLFEIGSTICGAAPNMDALIVGRVIAGAGGSIIYLGILNYFTALAAKDERGRYITLAGLCWGLGCVSGPLVGGAFTHAASWRWAFYINLLIGVVVIPSFLFCMPPTDLGAGVPAKARMAKLDFLGFALSTAAWASFAIGANMAGTIWPWNDIRTQVTFACLGATMTLFLCQQYFCLGTTPDTRAFPGHLLRSRTQVLLAIESAAGNASLFVMVYFIPLYFQFVEEDSALAAAYRLIPYIVVAFATNLAIGHFLSKIGYYMPIYLLAGVLTITGGALLVTNLRPGIAAGLLYGFSIIVAGGTGLGLQIGYAVATLTVSTPADESKAVSLQNITQIGSSLITLVIAGQVYHSVAVESLARLLAPMGYSRRQITSAVAGAQSSLIAELDEETRTLAVAAIVEAMRRTFALVIAAGAVTVLAAVGMKKERLRFAPRAAQVAPIPV